MLFSICKDLAPAVRMAIKGQVADLDLVLVQQGLERYVDQYCPWNSGVMGRSRCSIR